jgi:type I restriction enzyme S subunit
MCEWVECKIGDVCSSISDTYKRKAQEVVLINTSDVLEGKCLNHQKTPNKNLKGQFKKTFQADDILYSEIRPANKRFAYIDFTPTDYIASTKLMVLRHNDKIDSRYLFYVLTSQTLIDELQLLAESRSGTFPQITFSELSRLSIKLPPLTEQRRILSIFKNLDDKIEVNRRINDVLEQQAQALFKSWFVDFEPFRSKPFVESELGMIPEGWRAGTLGELCTFKRGKNLLTKNAINGGVPVVAGGLEPSCYHNVSNTKSPVVTVSGSGANAGYMKMYYQEAWASDCSFIDSSCDYLYFVYCFLQANKKLLKHAQTGAVQPHVKPSDIHEFSLIIPPQNIIERFQDIIIDLTHKRANLEKQSIALASIRDTLLPRLMSGELKVKDIEDSL